MPRDSGGTYTLPAGNPVVTLTVISSTWANTTLSDLSTAMTNSLDRGGAGGMTGQLKLANGAIGAPGLTWGTETTSGLYRAGAGDFRFAIGGVDVWTIGAGGVGGTFGLANGTAALPSLYFASDPDTGIYRVGANRLGITSGGMVTLAIDGHLTFGTGVTIKAQDGSAALPVYTFDADLDTGMFRAGANDVRLVSGGVTTLVSIATGINALAVDGLVGSPPYTFLADTNTGFYRAAADSIGVAAGGTATAIFTATQFQTLDGSVGAPAWSFFGDINTGIYRIGADNFALVTNGAIALQVAATFVESDLIHRFVDGAVGSPGIQFLSDTNTGIYRIGADNFGFSTNGVLRFDISTTALTSTLPYVGPVGAVGTPTFTFTGDLNTGMYQGGADDIRLSAGGVNKFTGNATTTAIDTVLLRATGIHNGTAPTGAANQYIASGTYTPTISNTTNVDASTAQVCQWMRVGNVVTVSGQVDIDPTAATPVTFNLSLPIVSALAAVNQLAGSGIWNQTPANAVMVRGAAASDDAQFNTANTATANTNCYFHFTYLVL